jgi:hypothetical protein
MRVPNDTDLLALWERGRPRHPLDRALLLGAWARPDLEPTRLAGLPLGVLATTLLRLRAACFGPRIEAYVDCEHCGERLALELAVDALLAAAGTGRETAEHAETGIAESGIAETEIDGVRLRAPTSRDLAAVAAQPDGETAARRLIKRCCTAPAGTSDQVLDGLRERIEAALETLDPAADLALALTCGQCGHQWTASLDIGALLWDEIDSRAAALIGEVHRLARAYGWTEPQILALSPARRAAYLDLVSP